MKTNNALLCFLDILGYGQLIEKTSPESLYDKFQSILSDVYKIIDAFPIEYQPFFKKIKIQIISDSILIIYNLNEAPKGIAKDLKTVDDEIMCAGLFFQFISLFIGYFSLKVCIFLRGSIVKDQYWDNKLPGERNMFICSRALVKSAKLEKTAEFPCVVVDVSILDYLEKYKQLPWVEKFFPFKINPYSKGVLLDFYEHFKSYDTEFLERSLIGQKKMIEEQLLLNKERQKELQKCLWYKEYHNAKILEWGITEKQKYTIN